MEVPFRCVDERHTLQSGPYMLLSAEFAMRLKGDAFSRPSEHDLGIVPATHLAADISYQAV